METDDSFGLADHTIGMPPACSEPRSRFRFPIPNLPPQPRVEIL